MPAVTLRSNWQAHTWKIDLDLSSARDAFLGLRGYWMVTHQFHRLDKVESFGPNVQGNVNAGLATTVRQLAEAEHVRGRLWPHSENCSSASITS